MPQVNVDKAPWDRSERSAPPDEAGVAFRGLAPDPELDSWGESRRDPVRLFRQSDDTDARLARLTEGLVAFPEVGQEFLGFRIVGELGRGAFGRVYLAHQGDLADRPVALKVSTGCFAESQKLARLQHTHIVPVYSFHRSGPLQAVVMPYFGPTTLADVLEALGRHDTLPASGKGLVSTLHSQRTRRSGLTPAVRPSSAPVAPSALVSKEEGKRGRGEKGKGTGEGSPLPLFPSSPLRMLEGMTYVQAALWIGARLAEGLAHAHERGVLHRDLKPANVLLTDEGQPMLLDFNLAEDAKAPAASAGRVGGTLPYMAPEHLAAYQGRPVDVDARSDIYALGVILYELLTGRHPFGRGAGVHSPGSPEALEQMMRDRTRLPQPARKLNRGVTPAVDSILRRCLAPEPARRYQTAAELQEDLDRQRQHRPLRHAPEPSLTERVVKWFRRNPRAVTAGRVGVAAGVLMLLLTALLFWRGEQVASYESADRLKGFRDDLSAARLLLGARAAEVDERVAGREAARRAVDRYGVDAEGRWRDAPSFRRLSDDEKGRVQAELGQALLLLASSEVEGAGGSAEEALRLNRLAETCYPGGTAPRALWAQRADLEARLGHDDEARRLRETADAAPVRDDGDTYLLARDKAGQGRLAEAAGVLRAVAAREPNNFAVQFLMGNCLLDGYIDRPGQDIDAVGCYSACIALRPDFPAAYANRGLMRLRRGLYPEAEADFTRAIELRPAWAEYLIDRARARDGLRHDQEEVDDLNQAEELGSKSILLYYFRAAAQGRMGHEVSGRRDLDRVLRMTPDDEDGFVSRGMARALNGDTEDALADFAEAVKRNSASVPGLQDQARLLADALGRNREALAPLDRLLDLYPAYAAARGARAVVRARLGMRDEALADVQKALQLDPDGGGPFYQAAVTHALLAPAQPAPAEGAEDADRAEAFRMLCRALQKGYGWADVERNQDLASLRKDPRYADLVRTAGLLRRNAER